MSLGSCPECWETGCDCNDTPLTKREAILPWLIVFIYTCIIIGASYLMFTN